MRHLAAYQRGRFDPFHLYGLAAHVRAAHGGAREIYSELKNLCVWNKDNGGMGSLYRSKHELVFVFKNGTAPHINNVELGRFGRNRTNVWDYPGRQFTASRDGSMNWRCTRRSSRSPWSPTRFCDCSKRGGIVLDCFGGSGTTLIAAEKTGRRGYVIELDPVYVDIAINRFEKLTGRQAIHTETGLTFAEMRLERVATAPKCIENTCGIARRRKMSNDNEGGYGKPPKDKQFKKGQSGNPKGRPKHTKNLKTDLKEELQETIVAREEETAPSRSPSSVPSSRP